MRADDTDEESDEDSNQDSDEEKTLGARLPVIVLLITAMVIVGLLIRFLITRFVSPTTSSLTEGQVTELRFGLILIIAAVISAAMFTLYIAGIIERLRARKKSPK